MSAFALMLSLILGSSTESADSISIGAECLLVANAHIKIAPAHRVGKKFQDYMRLANAGHEIEAGKLAVLAIRDFVDENKGVDSQLFKKLTMEIPYQVAAANFTRTLKITRSYYTAGGTGFIQRGEYFLGKGFNPVVQLSGEGRKPVITVAAEFDAVRPSDGHIKHEVLRYSCPLKQVEAKDLDEWEGKPGSDWNSFASG